MRNGVQLGLNADLLDDKHAIDFAPASSVHNPVTLDTNADTLLSLSTQALGLDTQVANTVLAGPASGADAAPTFRALTDDDLGMTRHAPLTFDAATGADDVFNLSGLGFPGNDPEDQIVSLNGQSPNLVFASSSNPMLTVPPTFRALAVADLPNAGAVRTVADTTTELTTDDVIVCNKGTAMTVNLLAATGTGRQRIVKNIGAGVVTVDANSSETIDGATTQALSQWDAMQIVDYASGKWVIV